MNLLADEHRRRKIAGRSHCRPEPPAVRSPFRRPWSRPSPASDQGDRPVDADLSQSCLCDDSSRRQQEAVDILRHKLNPQCRPEGIAAEDVQIFVEVA